MKAVRAGGGEERGRVLWDATSRGPGPVWTSRTHFLKHTGKKNKQLTDEFLKVSMRTHLLPALEDEHEDSRPSLAKSTLRAELSKVDLPSWLSVRLEVSLRGCLLETPQDSPPSGPPS